MSAPDYSLWVKDLQPDDLQRFALDLVQPKYDGWYATLVIKNRVGKFWSRGGKLLKKVEFSPWRLLKIGEKVEKGDEWQCSALGFPVWGLCDDVGSIITAKSIPHQRRTPIPPDAVIMGEMLINTEWAKAHPEHGWFIAFDMDVWQQTYGTRLFSLRAFLMQNPLPMVRLIESEYNYGAGWKDSNWSHWVEKLGFEGLVFRRMNDMGWYAYRLKKKQTWDFWCAGAIHAIKSKRISLLLSDRFGGDPLFKCWVRRSQWDPAKEGYRATICEIEGMGLLKSGAVRSPVFKRWRPDKQPAA